MPEDYPEAGARWEHLARHGIPFRNYGGQTLAQALGASVSDPELKRVADMLYWNVRRIELDARAGELVLQGRAAGRIDVAAIEAVLQQHERVIREHFPVEPNDPKSAEVVMRGIRRIRAELQKAKGRGTGAKKTP